MIKQAKDLKKGDQIPMMGKTLLVVEGATVGINTPKGKVELVVQYPNGNNYPKVWNKATMIRIITN